MIINPKYAQISHMQESVECMIDIVKRTNDASRESILKDLYQHQEELNELMKDEKMFMTQEEYDDYNGAIKEVEDFFLQEIRDMHDEIVLDKILEDMDKDNLDDFLHGLSEDDDDDDPSDWWKNDK